MAGQWGVIYPSQSNSMQSPNIPTPSTEPGSPVVATQSVQSGNGPTLSLVAILILFFVIRLFVQRGIKPGE